MVGRGKGNLTAFCIKRNDIVIWMKCWFTLVLSTMLFGSYSFAKCFGYDDLRPSYCVRIVTKTIPEKYEDGCTVEYELVSVVPALPVDREYPYWKKAYITEGNEHYIKIDKAMCEKVTNDGNSELKGISSQFCYDNVFIPEEYWIWLKSKFGIRTIKPKFVLAEKAMVRFHDKGLLEVSCPEGF